MIPSITLVKASLVSMDTLVAISLRTVFFYRNTEASSPFHRLSPGAIWWQASKSRSSKCFTTSSVLPVNKMNGKHN